MSKTLRLLLGIITFWPAAYMVIFFVFIVSTIVFTGRGGGGDEVLGPLFAAIFVLHFLTMLVIAALTVFYMVNVFRNERVEKDKKVLWAVVLFLGNVIAMPIYWYVYFWKTEPELPTFSAPGQLGSADTSAWTNNARPRTSDQHEYVPPAQPPNWRD